ncbi:response regulator transcription factor [Streptomyces sp. NPDC008343]|uniref:response regulator transcription factor n=1 Tax=Streptomyces sp. NPDC008343 TaxID=3364828 RepID=UPI0036EA7432
MEEFVLRSRGLLRRNDIDDANVDESVLAVGELALVEKTRAAHCDGTPIELTANAFDQLWLLMSHPRPVLSKTQILDQVWSSCFDASETSWRCIPTCAGSSTGLGHDDPYAAQMDTPSDRPRREMRPRTPGRSPSGNQAACGRPAYRPTDVPVPSSPAELPCG